MQPIATERGPQLLAGMLNSLAQEHQADHKAYIVLADARERLRVISWTRFRARHEREDRIAVMLRRHTGAQSGGPPMSAPVRLTSAHHATEGLRRHREFVERAPKHDRRSSAHDTHEVPTR